MITASPEAEVETIRAIGLVLVAVVTAGFSYLGVTQERTRRHAKATRQQVQNTHETNLRDDLDDLKATVDRRFTRIENYLGIEQTLDHHPNRRRHPRRRLFRRSNL